MECQTVGYIHGASRTVEELRETVIKFDCNKVVAEPAKHDEAGEAEKTDLTLPDRPAFIAQCRIRSAVHCYR
jgi:hypothetical protein